MAHKAFCPHTYTTSPVQSQSRDKTASETSKSSGLEIEIELAVTRDSRNQTIVCSSRKSRLRREGLLSLRGVEEEEWIGPMDLEISSMASVLNHH
jgi:hypothetical protein